MHANAACEQSAKIVVVAVRKRMTNHESARIT